MLYNSFIFMQGLLIIIIITRMMTMMWCLDDDSSSNHSASKSVVHGVRDRIKVICAKHQGFFPMK